MANPARSICITCVSPFQPGVTIAACVGQTSRALPGKDSAGRCIRNRCFQTDRATPPPAPRGHPPDRAPPPLPQHRNRQCRSDSLSPNGAPSPARRPGSAPRRRALPQHQRTNALRPADLVGRDHRHPRPQPVERHRHLAERLRRIASPPAPRAGPASPRSRGWPVAAPRQPDLTPQPDRRRSTGRSMSHHAVTASCSTAAQRKPRPANAKAAASVAPEVKTISAPSAPNAAATSARAASITALAARPSACTLDGLPTTSIAASHRRPRLGPQRRCRIPVKIDPRAFMRRPPR